MFNVSLFIYDAKLFSPATILKRIVCHKEVLWPNTLQLCVVPLSIVQSSWWHVRTTLSDAAEDVS